MNWFLLEAVQRQLIAFSTPRHPVSSSADTRFLWTWQLLGSHMRRAASSCCDAHCQPLLSPFAMGKQPIQEQDGLNGTCIVMSVHCEHFMVVPMLSPVFLLAG